jgi:hypothetical protein
MSHCSKFDLKFKDKRVLFSAMRNLDMKPENQVWESYKSFIGKMLAINGEIIGRLLTGYSDGINIFFTEKEGVYTPNVESHVLQPEVLKERGRAIIEKLRKEYVKCSIEKLRQGIIASGQSVTLISETSADLTTFTLEIGGSGKKLVVSLDDSGGVTEQVTGVAGRSCVDLTAVFETMAAENTARNWTFEYDELVEDQLIQVLTLRR